MMPRILLVAAVLLAAACTHDRPELSGPSEFEEPFTPGEPVRLTYAPGPDRDPLWSPDAGRVLYAFDQGRRLDSLVTGCVADLPATGGSRGPEICETDPTRTRVEMRPFWPARGSDGSTAFYRQYWAGIALNPGSSDLAVVPPGLGMAARSVLQFPYFAPVTGRTHFALSHLQWLDASHLVYLARVQLNSTMERVNSGIEIVVFTVDSGIAGAHVIPGTLYASSVARGATGDTIYYTLGGDSLVYRRVLSTGAIDTVYSFGDLGIVRDVQVRGGKLVAVVGGNVTFHSHPSFGMVQDDFGGRIYAATLPAGLPVAVTDSVGLWQHLALAPDGSRVVGEMANDLWSVAVP